MVTRRQLLGRAMLALPLAGGLARPQDRVPVADMHSHFGIITRRMESSGLAEQVRAHGVALMAWKMVPDGRWLRITHTGVVPASVPPPGALAAAFRRQAEAARSYVAAHGLLPVLSPADVDRALRGEPGIVLSSEGADFLEGDLAGLAAAHGLGLRHLQLVHYIPTPVGDRQTAEAMHGGLSAFGRDLVRACNTQGILVDLAHCTAAGVEQALAASSKPMVWSHGWVDGAGGTAGDAYGYLQRRLSVDHARRIAAAGGVIGVWGLGLPRPDPAVSRGRGGWTVGRGDATNYAREVAQLVDLLGADHVALGTDIEGFGPNWAVDDYQGVRRVVDQLAALKLPAQALERVAWGNYARVLKAALSP